MKPYRWTKSRVIRMTIAKLLFHELLDGLGVNDEKLAKEVWKRIDRELDAMKLTRADL